MHIRSLRTLLFVAAALLSTSFAAAQSFNIDVGSNTAFPLPSSSFGAALGQPGSWNAVSGVLGGTQALLDLSGTATTVTIAQTNGAADIDFNNPNTSGDDERLLDDAQSTVSGTTNWTISGLANATYEVVVYAWAADNPTGFLTDVTVTNGVYGLQTCGGAPFLGSYEYGVTHVADTVVVTANVIVIGIGVNTGQARCAAIQIQQQPSGFGTVIQGPLDVCTLGGHIEAHGVEWSYGSILISGEPIVVNGPAFVDRINPSTLSLSTSYSPLCTGTAPFDFASMETPSSSTVWTVNGTTLCEYTYNSAGVQTSCTVKTPVPPPTAIAYDGGSLVYYTDTAGALYSLPVPVIGGASGTFIKAKPAKITSAWKGLGFDPASGTLWGSWRGGSGATNLVQFSELTIAGALTGVTFFGTTAVPVANLVGGCDVFSDATFTGGKLAIIALQESTTPTCDSVVVYSLAVDYCSDGALQTYCTAGTTTSGCVPVISAAGTPSASAGSGFTIDVTSMEGQKQGLIFYGLSGAAAVPWGIGSSSFLCVKSPTQRTPAQSSGGISNQCNGVLVIDWNAYIAANAGALGNPFAGGESVWAQGWFRDPPASKTTNLSDGLTFVVCP